MDETETTGEQPVSKKAPRKPRPSELAAKAAKKKKTAKPKAKKAKKPAAKKKPVKKSKAKRPAKKAAKRAKSKKVKAPAGVVRFERIDMRLSKTEKARIVAKAKKLRRTVTSIVLEAIEKIK
jgi:histone H1/5